MGNIQLTDKQKAIINLMRKGMVIQVSIQEGNKANKYYMGNSIRRCRRMPIVFLHDDGLIKFNQLSYNSGTFTLTELGKTIQL